MTSQWSKSSGSRNYLSVSLFPYNFLHIFYRFLFSIMVCIFSTKFDNTREMEVATIHSISFDGLDKEWILHVLSLNLLRSLWYSIYTMIFKGWVWIFHSKRLSWLNSWFLLTHIIIKSYIYSVKAFIYFTSPSYHHIHQRQFEIKKCHDS